MALLLFIAKIGKAEIRQYHDSKLYNVKCTDTMGNTSDVGDFKSLDQARNIAYRFRTGADSRHSEEDRK